MTDAVKPLLTPVECRGILHDLKNYLFMLDSSLALLKDTLEASGDPRSLELFAAALHSAARMRKIVTSNHERQSIFSLSELFLSVACEFKDPGLDIHFASEVENTTVLTRHTDMLRIVRNILENAVEAMRGQKVRVITATVRASGAGLALHIKNSGPKIPGGAPGRELIFTEGYSTKSEGRGVGLATSRRLAEANGGSLGAKNCKGGGVAFVLSLPAG